MSRQSAGGQPTTSGLSPGAGDALLAAWEAEPAGGWAFQQEVERYTQRCGQLWLGAAPAAILQEPGFMPEQQARREAETDRHVEQLRAMLRRCPPSRSKHEGWRSELLAAARQMASDCLDFPQAGLDLLFTDTGLGATQQFVREARAFDPGISEESLYQALRNLWIINCVQLFLEHRLATTPAGFGYSMLYPWTDNYLDDPRVATASKARFCRWLGSRLRGVDVAPSSPHDWQVSQLVARIEECFPRSEYEDVYLSLLAIHRAQMRSLQQQEPGQVLDDDGVLRVTMEKGGTSVLADAYLVKGWLSAEEAGFMFGFGVLLQLLDDLQDLQDDLDRGHSTIFTRQAQTGSLDEPTARLWSFAPVVLGSSARFAGARCEALQSLIHKNCKLMILRTVARHHHFYSRAFLAELESRSPFGFEFLRRREQTVIEECREALDSLRARRRIASVFDLVA